jgi:hypothetical protein
MFSSLEEDQRSEVIEKCYWPLLSLADKGYKLGIELTGLTLELINSIDNSWVEKFKRLLSEKKIELIGSGYAQIIGPLVPAKVNDRNQKLGLDIYMNLLGVRPEIALVNEMAYSGGLVEHYLNNGYETIIMEWNNPRKYHPEWSNELRYYAQKAVNQQGKHIDLIWADSIAFQKFQRFAHGELPYSEYRDYIDLHKSTGVQSFPLYASDAEVFDFRPGRFKTEANIAKQESEWSRIEALLAKFSNSNDFQLIFPSEVLNDNQSNLLSDQLLTLESTEHPIPVKKQAKYNITRWALTGRNDLWLNTVCYRMFLRALRVDDENYWKKLCYFWCSDFRTHITSKRWKKLLGEIDSVQSTPNKYNLVDIQEIQQNPDRIPLAKDQKYKTMFNAQMEVILNQSKGCTIQSYRIPSEKYPLFGTLEHGYFDDIEYGVDYFSGHAVIEQLGSHKITDISAGEMEMWETDNSDKIWVDSNREGVNFQKEMVLKENSLQLLTTISIPSKKKEIIHPFHFTLIPEGWDQESLYYGTRNGGSEIEIFPINYKDFNHGDNHSFLISSKHGLGNTNGILIIGDKNKNLHFSINLEYSFLIPSMFYKRIDESKFLFRLIYSAQEIDETSRISDNNYQIQSTMNISYSTK